MYINMVTTLYDIHMVIYIYLLLYEVSTWNPLCTHTHLLMFPMAGTFLHLLGKRLLLLKVAALTSLIKNHVA